MKSSKVILALWLGASAWAQVQPLKQQANTPATGRAASSLAATLKAPVAGSKSPATVTLPSAKPNVSAKQAAAPAKPTAIVHSKQAASYKVVRKPSVRLVSQSPIKRPLSEKVARTPSIEVKGRRDPFVSPVVERIRNAATCTGSGKQCLVVSEISLHGVVHSPGGFIAVVMNGEHTYFLRENDPLADGAVERITKDAIILRERSSDALGRPSTREVTKRLGVPSV
jgi:hypothetical protein